MCLFLNQESFLFLAEDVIRDTPVTGVQTWALPISRFVTPGQVSISVMALRQDAIDGGFLISDFCSPRLRLPIKTITEYLLHSP